MMIIFGPKSINRKMDKTNIIRSINLEALNLGPAREKAIAKLNIQSNKISASSYNPKQIFYNFFLDYNFFCLNTSENALKF